MAKIIFLDIDGVLNTAVFNVHLHHITRLVLREMPYTCYVANGRTCIEFEGGPLAGKSYCGADQAAAIRDAARIFANNISGSCSRVHFDPMAVQHLADLVAAPREDDVQIVISSSWRTSGLSFMQKLWAERELPGRVVDITPYHVPATCRGQEIDQWLRTYPDIERYVIIDDDSDMLPRQKPFLVQTNGIYGLSAADVKKARKILELP